MPKARLLTLVIVAALAALSVFALSGATAATACPAFTVLHNDKIGAMSVPAGQYTIAPQNLNCAQASKLFTRFLSDWDGVLPGGWGVVNEKTKGFAKTGSTESFTIKPGAVKPSGRNLDNGPCPGTFSVLHNDRIGDLYLRKGQYKITTTGLHCWFDSTKLAYFLNHDASGKLPRPWTIDAEMMKVERSMNYYFTLRYVGNKTGGGVYPGNAALCPTKSKVSTSVTIEGMPFAAGSYYLQAFSGFTCSEAATAFKQFVAKATLPPDWTVDPATATFLTGGTGFQVDPAS